MPTRGVTRFTRLEADTGLTIPAGSIVAASYAAGSVASVALHETAVKYAEVSIAAADLKTIRATPITLVAAPGAGKVIEFLGGILILDYGSEVLAETSDDLAVKYTDGSGAAASATVECTGFIDQSADTLINMIPAGDVIMVANAALVLHNTGDGEFTGNASDDSVLRVKLAYRVHTTGL